MGERPDFVELIDGKLYLVVSEDGGWARVQQGMRFLLCNCIAGRQGRSCPHKERVAAYQEAKYRLRCQMPVSVMRAAGTPDTDIIQFLANHADKIGSTEQQKSESR